MGSRQGRPRLADPSSRARRARPRRSVTPVADFARLDDCMRRHTEAQAALKRARSDDLRVELARVSAGQPPLEPREMREPRAAAALVELERELILLTESETK